MTKKVLLRQVVYVLLVSTVMWILMSSRIDMQSTLRFEPSPFQRDEVRDVTETEYFDHNQTGISIEEDNYVITGESICKHTNKKLIIILIPSVPKDLGSRNILRNNWIRALKTNAWPNEKLEFEFKVAFVFGNGYSKEENKLLQVEKNVYEDIVQGDFTDNSKNSTRKSLFGLKWVAKYCSMAKYVVKMNSDTFAHVPKLLRTVQVYNDSSKRKIFCRLYENTVPRRDGEVQFLKYTNRLQYYPPYCDGAVYVISGNAVHRLIRAGTRIPRALPEDVFITGILAKRAKVNRINILLKLNLKDKPEWECIFRFPNENDPVYIADSGYSPGQIKTIWKCLKYGPDLDDYIRRVEINSVLIWVFFTFVVLLILFICNFVSFRRRAKK